MPKAFAATIDSHHSCPMCNGATPHAGGPVVTGSPNVFINGKPVARLGDFCACCGAVAKIATGHANVFVNGLPIATTDSLTSHGGRIVTGSPNVLIGNRKAKISTLPPAALPVSKVAGMDRLRAKLAGTETQIDQALHRQRNLLEVAERVHSVADTGADVDAVQEPPLPYLQGEILFCNGYLSDPIKNRGGTINAATSTHPDRPGPFTFRGENASETNRTDPLDYDTAQNRERRQNPLSLKRVRERDIVGSTKDWGRQKVKEHNPLAWSLDQKYYSYWNKKANNFKGTAPYAEFFNAEGHVHFVNGSHGLASNGAHRVDHGIALGYAWASKIQLYLDKQTVDEGIGEHPVIESYTPPFRPVTVVGHSQGVCCAAGVVLGILKYAADRGYAQAPVNVVLLGVHQGEGLYGARFRRLMHLKRDVYEVNANFLVMDADSWYGKLLPAKRIGREEEVSKEFVNALSNLFNEKYNKLYHDRGLREHVSTISDWPTFVRRAVQFTFTNDRGDIVLLDGDIAGITSSCDPATNQQTISAHYHSSDPFGNGGSATDTVHDLRRHGTPGGFALTPAYALNRRFEFEHLKNFKKTKSATELTDR